MTGRGAGETDAIAVVEKLGAAHRERVVGAVDPCSSVSRRGGGGSG